MGLRVLKSIFWTFSPSLLLHPELQKDLGKGWEGGKSEENQGLGEWDEDLWAQVWDGMDWDG